MSIVCNCWRARSTTDKLTDESINKELSAILPPTKLAGLALRIRTAIEKISLALSR